MIDLNAIPKRQRTECPECGDTGWLVTASLSRTGRERTRIERCDACEVFDDDAVAVLYVAALATQAENLAAKVRPL